jgi:hypothetical protein
MGRQFTDHAAQQPAVWLRPLTMRQKEVVLLVMAGDGYKQISGKLRIAWQTARLHVTRIADSLPGDAPPLRKVAAFGDAMLAFTELVEPKLDALIPRPSLHREREVAQSLLGNAISRGDVVEVLACAVCSSDQRGTHAHHTDYSKPLDVVWLCTVCHMQVHQRERTKRAAAA